MPRAPKQTNRTAHRHRPRLPEQRSKRPHGHREREGRGEPSFQSRTMATARRPSDRAAGPLMDLALLPSCAELFHTAAGAAYADLRIDGHRETWPIRSRRFRAFLRGFYYETTGHRCERHNLQDRARSTGSPRPVRCTRTIRPPAGRGARQVRKRLVPRFYVGAIYFGLSNVVAISHLLSEFADSVTHWLYFS